VLIQSTVLAHFGGKHDVNSFDKIWENTKTKEKFKGTYLYATETTVYLETSDGILKEIPLGSLTQSAKQIVVLEQQRITNLNNQQFSQFKNRQTPIITDDKNLQSATYLYLILLSGIVLLALRWLYQKITKADAVFYKVGYASLTIVLFLAYGTACKKSSSKISGGSTGTGSNTPIISFTNDPLTMDAAFNPYKPVVSTSWNSSFFLISSNGLPTHNMMVGITAWQQQVPIPQAYTGSNAWSIPLNPSYATSPLSTKTNLMKGAVAVAVNGIPIFNALNNRGEDSYAIGELDQWGGHCGKADDYHYHAAPLHLQASSGLKPIAYALDGFAVYGAKEPDGTTMTSLDTCHGHAIGAEAYHYHGTTNYPYVVGAMKGKVSLDPSTTAPENQILPQAMTKPIRPAGTPLTGAVITGFTANGSNNGYLLEYAVGAKKGSIQYSWTSAGKYSFTFTDINGNVSNQTY
jgi:hypothetical protein